MVSANASGRLCIVGASVRELFEDFGGLWLFVSRRYHCSDIREDAYSQCPLKGVEDLVRANMEVGVDVFDWAYSFSHRRRPWTHCRDREAVSWTTVLMPDS